MVRQHVTKQEFPALYQLDRIAQAIVLLRTAKFCGGKYIWDLCFQRNLLGNEATDQFHLLASLDKVFLSFTTHGKRLRWLDAKGQFSMKSFCEVLQGAYLKEEGWQQNWNKLVAPRILAFCRLARLQKIPTVDKLKKRRQVLV